AEVVGVRECADAAFDEGAELDIFCVKRLVHMIPFLIGDSISFAADVEPEEVIILERHHRLDDVVQTLQACTQQDLDPSPNGGIDIFELDADARDAIDKVHDADCSDFMPAVAIPDRQIEAQRCKSRAPRASPTTIAIPWTSPAC